MLVLTLNEQGLRHKPSKSLATLEVDHAAWNGAPVPSTPSNNTYDALGEEKSGCSNTVFSLNQNAANGFENTHPAEANVFTECKHFRR